MKKRKAILMMSAIACLTIALFVGLRIKRAFSASGPMPVYQGRTAREWLDQVFTTNQAAAFEAFRAMGTNALPVLVRALNDSQWDRVYGSMYSNTPVAIRKHLSSPNSELTWSAAELMLVYNPDSYRAFPELAMLLQDKRNRARQYIIEPLKVRTGQHYDQCIPIFIECLRDPNPAIQAAGVNVLGEFGFSAEAAVPALLKLLGQRGTRIPSRTILEALEKIDFEAAQKYKQDHPDH